MGSRQGVRTSACASSLAAALMATACASGAGPYEAPGGLATTEEWEAGADRPRIVTFPTQLDRAREVDIGVHERGYLAVFELRPGSSVAMSYPYQGDLVRQGVRILGVEREANLLDAGVHRIRRPAADAEAMSYPYHCRSGHRDFRMWSDGRWLMVLWSPEPFDFDGLWGPVSERCGIRDAHEQADAIVQAVAPDYGARRWKAELIRY